MVSCAVKSCKKTSYHKNHKKQGITFHLFPQDPELKRKWLDAIKRDDSWIPTKRSTICSRHFPQNAFHVTKKGYRSILKGSVPSLLLIKKEKEPEGRRESGEQEDIPNSLSTSVRVFTLEYENLKLRNIVKEKAKLIRRLREAQQRLCKKVNIQYGDLVKVDEKTGQSSSSQSTADPPASVYRKPELTNIFLHQDASDSDTSDLLSISETGDEYDALGKYVAHTVRQLDEQQRMFVEKIIYEAISAANMGGLNVNSKLIINSKPSDDRQIMSSKKEANSEIPVEINVDFDRNELEYPTDENCGEREEISTSYGHCRDRVTKNDADTIPSLKEPEDASELEPEDEHLLIKVEALIEDDKKLPQESELSEQPFEEVLIKREVETEDQKLFEDSELSEQPFEDVAIKQEISSDDEELPGDSKTEFVINKQQSSIEVYRSSDAKRRRTDGAEAAKIHLELQDPNVKR